MSRIGKQAIFIPKRVNIEIKGKKILVHGPKGTVSRIVPCPLECVWSKEVLMITPPINDALKPFFGLTRTLIADMVKGVEEGFEKRLQFEGVGYRAKVEENYLILNVGYSKPVEILIPKQVSVNVENPTKICVSGLQKDIVGSFASKISSIRPPEPYKGKGIILEGTMIRRKAGKTGK
jgi:large subunit ribosomal protein L6